MNTKIHTHQLDMSDALRDYARSHIEDVVTRIFNKQNPTLDIEFSNAHGGQERKVKVTVHVPHSKTLVATAQDANPYAAVDMAADKITQELRRLKEKIQDANRQGVDPTDLVADGTSVTYEETPEEFDADLEAKL